MPSPVDESNVVSLGDAAQPVTDSAGDWLCQRRCFWRGPSEVHAFRQDTDFRAQRDCPGNQIFGVVEIFLRVVELDLHLEHSDI